MGIRIYIITYILGMGTLVLNILERYASQDQKAALTIV